MANFNTHMTGAVMISGTTATVLMMTHMFSPWELVAYFILGIVGGILPDIDSDSSIPIRWAFNILGVTAGFGLVLYLGSYYSLVELVFLWSVCFIGVRHGLFILFTRFTVHRGLIHSIPAGAFFSLATVILAAYVFNETALSAWLCGVFVFLGFLTHLTLDELFSVDLRGVSLKRSFGTALSFGSFRSPIATGLLYMLTTVLFYFAPPVDGFLNFILDSHFHQQLVERLVPVQG
jgi:hypothetical protein